MAKARTLFMSVAVIFLMAVSPMHAFAEGKIAVLQYQLKPVAAVDSGRYIKTQWDAKVSNRASELVKFTLTVVFVDSSNKILKEAASQCELNAHETRSFTDTVLVEAAVANKIASTRVKIVEASP